MNQETKQLLILLKLDAQRLFERIKYRAPEYLGVFSARRVREHFVDIFKNRYDNASLDLLSRCSEEVIVGLDQFYSKVDKLYWYLNHTQDMPMKVSDYVYHIISELEEDIETLSLYIDAELGVSSSRTQELKPDEQPQDESEPISFELSELDDFNLNEES